MKIQMPTPTGTHEQILFHTLRVGRYIAEVSKRPADWDTLDQAAQRKHMTRVQETLITYQQVLEKLSTAIYFSNAVVSRSGQPDRTGEENAEAILSQLEAELGDEYLAVTLPH